jgi:hypothetical protein
MPWRDEWLAEVVVPCVAAHGVALLVAATNTNVAPRMPIVEAMWRTRACRPLLARSWSARGRDVMLDERTMRVLVTAGAAFRDESGWTLVDADFVDLPVDATDMNAGLLAHVSVDVARLSRGDVRFCAGALSSNPRLVPSDLALDVAWDWRALATNASIAPERLMRLGGETSEFYAALSSHPALTAAHVRARPAAPWCWYTLSTRCVTPDDVDLPVWRGALCLNPSFSTSDLSLLGLERPRVCARHGYACAPRATAQGVGCGLRAAPVNWPVYLRLTDEPEVAMQEALDSGEDVEGACGSVLGNPLSPLGLAAWCVAFLSSRGALARWTCLTAVSNEMAHDRLALRTERRRRREAYASLVRVCLRRGVAIGVCRAIYGLLAPRPVAEVVRVTETARLVRFRCALRPRELWVPLHLQAAGAAP